MADAPAPTAAGGDRADASQELLYQHASSLMDLADMAAAIPLFERILARDPTNAVALEQLEAIYRSAERWQELVALLLGAAECKAEPARAVEWLDRAATVSETMLGDNAKAIEYRERIRDLAPTNAANLADLARLRVATPER